MAGSRPRSPGECDCTGVPQVGEQEHLRLGGTSKQTHLGWERAEPAAFTSLGRGPLLRHLTPPSLQKPALHSLSALRSAPELCLTPSLLVLFLTRCPPPHPPSSLSQAVFWSLSSSPGLSFPFAASVH